MWAFRIRNTARRMYAFCDICTGRAVSMVGTRALRGYYKEEEPYF
jgi:hypothetical protein